MMTPSPNLNIKCCRARAPNYQEIVQFVGIFFTQGEIWQDNRRFMLRHLRDFGFGRRFEELELDLNEEVLQFMDYLRNGPKYDFEKVLFQKKCNKLQ